MKRIALVLAAGALLLGSGCADPKDRRPGLRLSGELVQAPVDDWSFSDGVDEIFVETRTRYGLRHSVTTVCAVHGGALYVPSLYFDGGGFPDAKRWNRNVARDPRVRLEIAGRLYERRASLVTDAAEERAVLEAFAVKYPFWRQLLARPESERPNMVFLRMDAPG